MLFLDTNVLLYAISPFEQELDKQRIAAAIVETPGWAFSAQVLQEFYVNAIKPTPRGAGLTPVLATEYLESFLPDHPCQAIDAELVGLAQRLHQRFRIDWWDAVILAAAQRLGCSHILSEDFTHGQVYDGVTIINPFLELAA